MERRSSTKVLLYVLGGSATLCFGVSLIIGLGTGIGPYDLPTKARQLDKAIAESKRLGLPMTAAELTGSQPPDEQNAAIEAVPIAKQWVSLGNKVVNQYPWNDESEQKFEDLLAQHGKELDRFVTVVTSKPEWFVARDYDLGPNLLLPEMAEIKNIVKVLARRANMSAKSGDVDSALADWHAMRAAARHVSNEPFLIGLLVAIAIDAIALRSLEECVEGLSNDPNALAQWEDALLATKFKFDPEPALKGEFYMELNICRNFKEYGGIKMLNTMSSGEFTIHEIDPAKIKRDGTPKDIFAAANLTTFANYWNTVFKEMSQGQRPARQWSDTAERLSAQIATSGKTSELIAKFLFPVFAQADRALWKDDVNQDLALAYVRCLRYRAEKGKFPASLKVVESEFADPFNKGGTIQMSSSATELRVWSVGTDGKDDRGVIGYLPHTPGQGEPKRSDDIVFLWPNSLRQSKR